MLATPEPVLLVGGQAVNLWALYYESRTESLGPFVSRDVDILGDRATLEALAKLAGTKPQFFPLKPPSNEVGVVIAKDQAGLPLLIEVLRSVHGVSNEELQNSLYTVAVGQTKVKLPGPITLLQAKIANVADLKQVGRQDARHVRILAKLLPGYLGDLQAAVKEGRMNERNLIGFLEQLLAVITTKKATTVLRQLRLDTFSFFAELGDPQLPKVQAFLDKRLQHRRRS